MNWTCVNCWITILKVSNKQLSQEILKSKEISFTFKIFKQYNFVIKFIYDILFLNLKELCLNLSKIPLTIIWVLDIRNYLFIVKYFRGGFSRPNKINKHIIHVDISTVFLLKELSNPNLFIFHVYSTCHWLVSATLQTTALQTMFIIQ